MLGTGTALSHREGPAGLLSHGVAVKLPRLFWTGLARSSHPQFETR
jgi:hypothetical protein